MKKTIVDYNLKDKKVIIRVDLNVPIENGVITDDNRIVASLETIQHVINANGKVILLSHLGRIKTEEDKGDNSLRIVAIRLSELLGQEVKFCPFTRGIELETMINNMVNKEVVLIENTRYEDLDGEKESNNDPELAKYWASLGDIFINDAFGTSHRAHASNVGVGSLLPNGIGFLVKKEIENLENTLNNPERPFTVILGGKKIADKIKVIENLVEIADYILIGGGMSYTFLKAFGYEVGDSIVDFNNIEFCKNIYEKYSEKIILPSDILTTKYIDASSETKMSEIDKMDPNYIGVDIGVMTISKFNSILSKSKTVIWNGPVGVFEIDKFSNGTRKISDILSKLDAKVIIGGGDIVAAITKFGYKDKFSFISTGGGATLEVLEGKELPGVKIISDK